MLVASSLVLGACAKSTNQPTDNTPKTTEPAKKQPAVGGELIWDIPADPDTLALFWYRGSYAGQVLDRVYGCGLIELSYERTPQPCLAEAMPTVSDDKKTYTFKLRKGIKFHDGKPVTAKDIKKSYDILLDKDYAGSWRSQIDPVAKVEAPDDYTVVITTKNVFAPFLFGSASVPPVPSHLLEGIPVKDMPGHDVWKKPVGAGPWKFVEWKNGQYVLLERNPDWWRTGQPGVKGGTYGPYIERIRIKTIAEDNTAIAALEAGELTLKTSVLAEHVDRLKAEYKDKLDAYDWNRLGYGYQNFNNDNFPTNIKEVRQALSYGLNRDAIIQGVMNNKATKPNGFVPPIHWVYDKSLKGYDYNPQKAAELLEKAGFKKNAAGKLEKDGKVSKLKYAATKGSPLIDAIALQSQKDWQALGFEVELIMVDFNTLLEKHMKTGDFHVTFSGLGFSVDPHFSFRNYSSKNIILDAQGNNTGGNTARYKNPRVDELIDQGEVTLDVEARKKIYHEAQRLIVEDAPANWIYVNLYTDFVKKDVKGIVLLDGYGISYYDQWWINEK